MQYEPITVLDSGLSCRRVAVHSGTHSIGFIILVGNADADQWLAVDFTGMDDPRVQEFAFPDEESKETYPKLVALLGVPWQAVRDRGLVLARLQVKALETMPQDQRDHIKKMDIEQAEELREDATLTYEDQQSP